MTFLTLGRPLGHCLVAPFAVIVEGFLPVDVCPFLVAFTALLGVLLTFLERMMAILAFLRGVFLVGKFHFPVTIVQSQWVVNSPENTNRQKR
jgi:hypothetical protein